MVLASQQKRFLINILAGVSAKSAKTTTAKKVMGLMENGKALFIDVRLPMHSREVHKKGALNANRKTVQEDLDDKTVPIICYCYSGFPAR
tara:strand:- start:514 stop:783 length:270 start_codon:yes stop_codon:yes gene_type:complete